MSEIPPGSEKTNLLSKAAQSTSCPAGAPGATQNETKESEPWSKKNVKGKSKMGQNTTITSLGKRKGGGQPTTMSKEQPTPQTLAGVVSDRVETAKNVPGLSPMSKPAKGVESLVTTKRGKKGA